MNKHHDIFAPTNCVSEEMLTNYISGKLSPAEKHEVEKHLVDCEMCSDAVEGLNMISDKRKISGITAGLNQKIQTQSSRPDSYRDDTKEEKKEIKIIFLQQYRTQLAVAASIVLVMGLVWFFKANIPMKEMDNAEAEKMFADKFEPPPSDLNADSSSMVLADKTEPDTKNPLATGQGPLPPPVENTVLQDAEEKAVAEETPSYSGGEGIKAGKDLADEKHLSLTENSKMEDIPVQNAEQLRKGIVPKKGEEKENFYWRNKNTEIPSGNVTTKSEVTTRDEDGYAVDEISKVTVTKESQKNELESLKEKDKKDESKKSQSTTTALTPKSVETTTAAGSITVSANQQADKSGSLAKQQDNKKPSDDRERKDVNNVSSGQSGEGDVLAIESEKKGKEEKSGGKNYKRAKSYSPQKVSGSYYDTQTSTSSPMPESNTEISQTETKSGTGAERNGKMAVADSVSANRVTFATTFSLDGVSAADSSMIKYNKQDYAGAVKNFEQTLKQNPNDEKALFYSAVSYLSLGQTEKALVNFNKILANKDSKYYDDAQWYSSLAYIKNNDLKNARSNLLQIQNNEKSKYRKQADETLEEIKK